MAKASSPALGFRVTLGRLWSGRLRAFMSQAPPDDALDEDLDLLDDLLEVDVLRSDDVREGRDEGRDLSL